MKPFPAPEAHRILQRLEFHYTPKHASWLNMVEIEIGVLRGQCLDRRIGERDVLVAEIEAWQRQRNASGARIKWKFTTEKARTALARVYPDVAERVEISVTRYRWRRSGSRQGGGGAQRCPCRSSQKRTAPLGQAQARRLRCQTASCR